MRVLAIDIGSSSVKAAILVGRAVPKRIVRQPFSTRQKGSETDVRAEDILGAVAAAILKLGPGVRRVDLIAHDAMGPSWLAMDRRGRALTRVVTHQDRRSLAEAREIEARVGRERHLAVAGNRPVPGGISSTTLLWHQRHAAAAMKRAALVGHLGTLICHALTGARVIDPSQASFTGLYATTTLSGWSDELIDALGAARSLLPEVREANEVAGRVTASAARRFGLREGTPVLAGLLDGSAAMLATPAQTGQLLNSAGSTDVLALLVNRPAPDERLLTRALGLEGRWLSVSTIAAAGTALEWARRTLFCDLSEQAFFALLKHAARRKDTQNSAVQFDAFLAGSRTSIEPLSGTIAGLQLGTAREDILAALIEFLRTQSGARLSVLEEIDRPMLRRVYVTGGTNASLAGILRRDWPKRFTFRSLDEATLLGLAELARRAKV